MKLYRIGPRARDLCLLSASLPIFTFGLKVSGEMDSDSNQRFSFNPIFVEDRLKKINGKDPIWKFGQLSL